MNSEKKQEFTRRISQANSTEMIVIIYDMTLEYLKDARSAIDGNADELHAAVGHVQGCFGELCNSLDYKYEPAATLRSLYGYCIRKIGSFAIRKEASILDDIERVVKPLRDAYDKVKGENTSGPVMGNSQEVYAGLTYGRNNLNENMASNSNRGFLV